MTNAVNYTLVKLVKARLIEGSTIVCCRSYLTSVRNSASKDDYPLHQIRHHNLVIKRDLASSSDSSGETNDRDRNSEGKSQSSAHREYHRQSYERKRSYYNRDRSSDRSQRVEPNPQNAGEMSHYQVLNIQQEADLSAIKSAYYSLSKLYHPDIVGNEDSEASENFRKITESYDILSDEKLRSEYDDQLNSKLYPAKMPQDATGSMHPHKDFNLIFRTRDADMIFRARQEVAFEREKALNPRKYRAGSFKFEQEDSRDRKESLSKRLESIRTEFMPTTAIKDGSDFYKMHLYDTIRRRKEGMSMKRDLMTKEPNTDPAIYSIITVLTIFGVILYVVVNVTFDIDLAAAMDRALQDTPKEVQTQKKDDIAA